MKLSEAIRQALAAGAVAAHNIWCVQDLEGYHTEACLLTLAILGIQPDLVIGARQIQATLEAERERYLHSEPPFQCNSRARLQDLALTHLPAETHASLTEAEKWFEGDWDSGEGIKRQGIHTVLLLLEAAGR